MGIYLDLRWVGFDFGMDSTKKRNMTGILGAIHKWRQLNFRDFWPPPPPLSAFYSTKITQPPLTASEFGQPSPSPSLLTSFVNGPLFIMYDGLIIPASEESCGIECRGCQFLLFLSYLLPGGCTRKGLRHEARSRSIRTTSSTRLEWDESWILTP